MKQNKFLMVVMPISHKFTQLKGNSEYYYLIFLNNFYWRGCGSGDRAEGSGWIPGSSNLSVEVTHVSLSGSPMDETRFVGCRENSMRLIALCHV